MAHTFAELQKQIAALQAEAEKLKASEVAGVVAKIKDAIKAYGLTHSDLFGGKVLAAVRRKPYTSTQARFADGKGNTWVGRGPRPQWLRDALKAGASLADFDAGKGAANASAAAPGRTESGTRVRAAKASGTRKAGKQKTAIAKYHDGAGQSWSGRGPKPKWVKAAIASGRKLEDLAV